SKRIGAGNGVLGGFEKTGRRDRSGDELDAERLELLGRQAFRQRPGPERMTVAGDDHEIRDAAIAYEIENLPSLHEKRAAEHAVRAAAPRWTFSRWKIL